MNIILEVYYLLGDLRYIVKHHLIKTGCHLIDFEVLYETCFCCSSQSIYCAEFPSNIEHFFSLVIFMNNSWHRVSTLTLFFSMIFCIFRNSFSLERMRLFRSFWMALNFTKACGTVLHLGHFLGQITRLNCSFYLTTWAKLSCVLYKAHIVVSSDYRTTTLWQHSLFSIYALTDFSLSKKHNPLPFPILFFTNKWKSLLPEHM